VPEAVLEHPDHAVRSHVQVLARLSAVRQVVGRETVHERRVDALRVEDVQQLQQAGGLLGLVAGGRAGTDKNAIYRLTSTRRARRFASI
jgi:hypothetical protein